MSQEDVQRLQRGADAFNERDLDTFFDCFQADVVHWNRADEPDAGVYRGMDEFKAYVARWLDMFEDLRIEVREWIDLGDHIIEVAEVRGRGSATGAPVQGHYVFLWTMRAARIAEGREYATKEEALAAVGG